MATDNEFLLRLPGTERRSDKIEGVLPPWERTRLIQEKGKKGVSATTSEKEILVYQLIQEYRRSNDPNIRRTAVESLGSITETAPVPAALSFLDDALRDKNAGVTLSAADALGCFGLAAEKKSGKKPNFQGLRAAAAEKLIARNAQLSYSIAAGAKDENERTKDLKLAILRNLGLFSDSPEIVAALADGLDGEKLDDGALRLMAMDSLSRVTKKYYGRDYGLWRDYIRYRNGETDTPPKEASALSRLATAGNINPLK